MKPYTPTLFNSIRKNHTVYVKPQLTVEWNYNRYIQTKVSNIPSEDDEGYDIESFPIESIAEPVRPTKGIAKAFVGRTVAAPKYTDAVPASRHYLASPESQYKYWRSPYPTESTAPYNFALAGGDTTAQPTVEYINLLNQPVDVKANKIVVTFETTNGRPDDFDIWIKRGGAWSKALNSNPAIDLTTGRVTIYWNGTVWTTTETFGFTQEIQGVRVKVRSMNAPTHLEVIEISARRIEDITADLMSASDSASMGEPDYITPMGDISSNTGSVTLWNGHENYSNENDEGPYYRLLDKNVKFSLTYNYETSAGIEKVQQFTLYSDSWDESESTSTVAVSLVDFSRHLQEIKPRPVMYQNVSVQEAIWRICDLIGFNSYNVVVADDFAHSVIDIFWTTGEQTVWDIFSELAKATQAAVFFDAYGVLQITTRDAAFNNAKTPVWTLRENQSGDELPDIIDITVRNSFEANKVTVDVQPTAFLEQKQGQDVYKVVWEPEGTVTLRAAELIRNLNDESTMIWMSQKDVRTWPYEGVVNIEGEFIRYSGKMMVFYAGNIELPPMRIKSKEEEDKWRAKASPSKRDAIHATGALYIEERGLWNTNKRNHKIDVADWNTANRMNYSNTTSPSAVWKHQKTKSIVEGDGSNKDRQLNDYSYFHRGNSIDEGYWHLGTRMRIVKGAHGHKLAGLFFNSNSVGEGYFIEVIPSTLLGGKKRQERNEILFYSMKPNGDKKVFGGESIDFKDAGKDRDDGTNKKKQDMGAEAAVFQGVWFELDIDFDIKGNGDHEVVVWFNGRRVMTATVPQGSGWQHSRVSRSGFFVRGQSAAEFDYFYGIARKDIPKDETEPYFDRIEGSWYSQQSHRDWMYREKKVRRRIKKKWKKIEIKHSQRLFDEFGPIIHEVREYDVKFNNEGLPVVQSKIFYTNEDASIVTEYFGHPFGAKFIVANSARRNVVINGEDTLGAVGGTTPPNNRFFVFGKPVIQKESIKVERKNDAAIARRGEIELEFSSKWIQSESEANALASWITRQWGIQRAGLEVDVFSNPLFELTDVLAVQFGDLEPATHKYYVTDIKTDWDNGVQTSLTLRRVV